MNPGSCAPLDKLRAYINGALIVLYYSGRNLFICCLALITVGLVACSPFPKKPCTPVEHIETTSGSHAPVLLFDGTGTSPCDVVAIENILDERKISYSTANTSRLNIMDEAGLRKYKLLIMPGGDFITMGNKLTSSTSANIRSAVHNGLSYLGVCAGGFLAGKSRYYNGFDLTSGVTFGFYSGVAKGFSKGAVAVTDAEGSTLDQYFENGPQFGGWGSVIGKYPDATPAVVEGTFGKGFIILSGIHAEAPDYWRGQINFTTPANVDNAYAARLIDAALNRKQLAHF